MSNRLAIRIIVLLSGRGHPNLYGTHSMRRTKATLVYAKTKDIRAVQLLLGHTRVDNTIRYLGVELEDALTLSESTDC